jgi:hypothetical protein
MEHTEKRSSMHQRVEMCYGWSGEVQNVGAEWRSAHGCTIVWICIFVGPGGVVVDCSGEVTLMHQRVEMHYSGLQVKKCTWTLEMHWSRSRKEIAHRQMKCCVPDTGHMCCSDQEGVVMAEHSREVKQCAPESGDVLWLK